MKLNIKVIIPVVVVLGVLVYLYTLVTPPVWETYSNSRYQFKVDYPPDWNLEAAPTNNDGRTITSPNGETTCHVYGFYNALLNEVGEPQTLLEFVDWLKEGTTNVASEKSSSLSQKAAVELVFSYTGEGEEVSRGVYTLEGDTGWGLVCTFKDRQALDAFDASFYRMRNSFKIDAVSADDVCALFEEAVDRCWCDESFVPSGSEEPSSIVLKDLGLVESTDAAKEAIANNLASLGVVSGVRVTNAVEVGKGFYNVFVEDEQGDETVYTVHRSGTVIVTQCGV